MIYQWLNSHQAFYLPNKDRPNFVVLLYAHVARVVLDPSADGSQYTATGVEFLHEGKQHTVHAKKEVIISAGRVPPDRTICHSLIIDLDRTMKSPQILELSGVGNPEILNRINVPTKINLPGVGENVQDHVLAGASFGDNYIAYAFRLLI